MHQWLDVWWTCACVLRFLPNSPTQLNNQCIDLTAFHDGNLLSVACYTQYAPLQYYLDWRDPLSKQRPAHWVIDVINLAYRLEGVMNRPFHPEHGTGLKLHTRVPVVLDMLFHGTLFMDFTMCVCLCLVSTLVSSLCSSHVITCLSCCPLFLLLVCIFKTCIFLCPMKSIVFSLMLVRCRFYVSFLFSPVYILVPAPCLASFPCV